MISALIEFLAAQYEQGDAEGMLVTTRSILAAIPDDLVALQFMGLAYLQLGQEEKAVSLFRKAAALYETNAHRYDGGSCLPAASITYREATRPESGLAGGWRRIATALERYGLNRLAERARLASIASQKSSGDQTHVASHERYKPETTYQNMKSATGKGKWLRDRVDHDN